MDFWRHCKEMISQTELFVRSGRVFRVQGEFLECRGFSARVGDVCLVSSEHKDVLAEVVSFSGDSLQLLAMSALQGVEAGARVALLGDSLRVPVGMEFLGRVVDCFGRPLDGEKTPFPEAYMRASWELINPLHRRMLTERFDTGIKAIEAFLPVAVGQKVGIFSGPGLGKSSLLGMIARNAQADVNVIALIGERGREVGEFLENDLVEHGLSRSVVVVSSSDTSPIERLRAAFTAVIYAEYFQKKGKKVLLLMDSLTRLAQAQRQLGLLRGETPSFRGYPPSVLNLFPLLLERCGSFATGSITGFFTVLSEGDIFDDPLSEALLGLLDGHFILDRSLAQSGIYPALDVLSSVSRLAEKVSLLDDQQKRREIMSLLSLYRDNEDLIRSGLYQPSSQLELDKAIAMRSLVNQFGKQGRHEYVDEQTWRKVFQPIEALLGKTR